MILYSIVILGKNIKSVFIVYLIYNLIPVISKQIQKFIWYAKNNNLVPVVKSYPLT